MSATDQDIRAIEYLAIRARQDTHGCGPWDPHGVHVVFADHFRGMHLATAIGIALAHAQDPEAKTPAAVKRPFTPELPKPDGRTQPPKRAESCLTCGRHRDTCICGERRARPIQAAPSDARDAALAACREAIHDAQTRPSEEEL